MYKLFIDGAFVRSESGRSDPLLENGEFIANIARGSRKDVRDCVVAARRAQPLWWKTAPSTRGLILYRLAEMLEARRSQFEIRLASSEVGECIDRTVWYAGWCDKYSALLSSRNPVAGPHFNFSTAEPMGVVALLLPDSPGLMPIVSTVLPALVAGNTVVAVAQSDPRTAIDFAEVLAISDIPRGVVNVLSGFSSELGPVLAKHMDVNAIAFEEGPSAAELQRFAAENVKRTIVLQRRTAAQWAKSEAQSLDAIAAYSEIKTIWHPAGI